MSNPLSTNWMYTTMQVAHGEDLVGTGFLVAQTESQSTQYGGTRSTWYPATGRIFFVTNRHVLGDPIVREQTLIYNADDGPRYRTKAAIFAVCDTPRNWAFHPDSKVDLGVLDVTEWLPQLADAHVRFCPLSEVANPLSMLEADCDAGDDVYVLGYPLGLRQAESGIPLVRKGILASSPRRRLRRGGDLKSGFLVDGAILPGSSGSPVVSASTRFQAGDLAVTTKRPLLLGVVATSQLLPTENLEQAERYGNLGYAVGAAALIETIMEFGHPVEDFLKRDHDLHWTESLGIPQWALEFDGREIDSQTAFRLFQRLHRDRLRAGGMRLERDQFLDAIELMGEVALVKGQK